MYRGARQCGFIPVLTSFGSNPLDHWEMKAQDGCIRRVTDEQVRALALELIGPNVSTCFMNCPKSRKQTLGIHMPYLVMIVKNLKKYFTFEITVLDDRNVNRRLRFSNFQRVNQIHHFSASMPLCLNPGWNEMYFDLHDFTRKAYKTTYVETTRMQIHANCRVRVIYFCDRIYENKDIPQKFKMFLPTTHVPRRKSTEETIEKKDVSEAEGETDYYGAEEQVEEMFEEEEAKSEEEKPESIKDEAEFLIEQDYEEEFYEEEIDEKEEETAEKPAEETTEEAEAAPAEQPPAEGGEG